MNWYHFCIAIVPNLLIIILSFALAEVSFEITIPSLLELIKKESNLYAINQTSILTNETNINATEVLPETTRYNLKYSFYIFLIYFIKTISIISFILFIWCWITAAVIDPGSVINDLKRRKIKVYTSNNDKNKEFLYAEKSDSNNANSACKSYNYLKNRNEIVNADNTFNSNMDNYFYCDALSLIRNGKIPYCLQNLPFCDICKIPRPPGAVHCSTCRCCILRCDHHCGILGQCVGDRNIKCFFLSFLYSSLFCFLHFSAALWYLLKTPDDFFSITNIVIFIFSVYTIIGGFSLLCFDVSFFCDFTQNFNVNNNTNDDDHDNTNSNQIKYNPFISWKMKWTKFLSTLGNSWFERILPIRNNTTDYAWKGVYWNADNYL